MRVAGCMMCTTISPASTSTHSPVCSPSTPMMRGAGRLQRVAHVLRQRLHLPTRLGGGDNQVSQRLVSLRTSRTVMFRALMSSRAETAVFWILVLRARCDTWRLATRGAQACPKLDGLLPVTRTGCIRSGEAVGKVGSGQYSLEPRREANHEPRPRPSAPRCERGTDRGCRDRLRRNLHAARWSRQACARGAQGRWSACAASEPPARAAVPPLPGSAPGRSTTTKCARVNRRSQRHHCVRPANESAPISSASGSAGCSACSASSVCTV